MKPKYNTSKFRGTKLGASLVTAITFCFGSTAFAVNNLWTGTVSNDWNTPGNWSLNRVPTNANGATTGDTFDDAVVSTITPNVATISANLAATPRDIIVGLGTGNTGRVNHTAGNAATGGGNWMYVGRNGGNGTYNLANPAGTGGTFTGMGLSSGNVTIGGRLYVGGWEGTGSTGVVNVNTTGTLTIGTMLELGTNTSTGTFNLDAGTVTAGTAGGDSWVEVGNGAGSTGFFNMSGGTFTKTGGQHFIVGANGSTGTANISGGTLSVNNEFWVANNAGSTGTLNLSGSGAITNNSWVAIGRNSATKGTVNMTGGSWTKTNGGTAFIVGASGPGEMNQSGGILNVQAGDTWIGESSTATYTLSGATSEMNVNFLQVARNASSTATLNLNGGTLRANRIVGGAGTETINFNGTQIIAKVTEANFFADIQTANIAAGGLKIDTNSTNLGSTQIFSGSGGITKSGVGTLTLAAGQTYTGLTTITGGKLVNNSSTVARGAFTVADGATLGVTTAVDNEQLTVSNLTVGSTSGAAIDFNLGNFAGNATNAALNVTGTLTRNGTVTLNVADQLPEIGTIPLIKYVPGSLAGSGNFVLGTLPLGVVGTLQNDTVNGLVSLNVTSTKVLAWDGFNSDQWDKVTQNWVNTATNTLTTYADPNPVFFNDNALSNFNVKLNIPVTPTLTTFANSNANVYNLSGTGKITGTGGLAKTNNGTASITGMANDYTGATTLRGGVLEVDNLGEASSSIGVASSDPSKLVFAGGTLRYIGTTPVTTSRGLLIDAADNTVVSTLSSDVNITLNGVVKVGSAANPSIASFGQFAKAGTGTLTLTNAGPNVLSAGGFRIAGGSVVLMGPGQTNSTGGLSMAAGTTLTLNSSTLSSTGDVNIGDAVGTTNLLLNGTSVMTSTNRINAGINVAGAVGNITISDSASLTTNAWLSVAQTGDGTLTVKDSGKLTVGADFNISDLPGSKGTYIQQGTPTVQGGTFYVGKGSGAIGTANISGGTLTVGNTYIANSTETLVDGVQTQPPSQGTVTMTGGTVNLAGDGGEVMVGTRGNGSWTMTAGTVNARGWNIVGRFPTVGANGTLNIGGTAVWNQLTANRNMIIGEETTGVVTVSGSGALNAFSDTGIMLANNATTGNGTLNINGGTVTAKQIREGAGGVSALNIDGGTIVAGAGALANFITGIDTVTIKAGGATINTNGNNVTVNQNLAQGTTAGGGLTKTGAGTLTINGTADYTGATNVNAGTLGGNVTFQGTLNVASGANVNPGGAASGTIAGFGNVNFAAGSTLTIDVGATSDFLGSSNLVITPGATLVVNGTLTQPSYDIGSFGTISGTFNASIPGYTVDYSNNTIKLVATGGGSPYQTYIGTYYPGVTDPAIVGPDADPDGDGSSNQVEFALGSTPNSGGSRPKVYTFVTDSSDAGSEKELVMTIAVRSGTPAFSGSPSPTATQDGATYTVQGSLNLTDFTSPVIQVDPITTGLPAAPAGYEYRTFSLTASNGVPNRGFLRVKVQ